MSEFRGRVFLVMVVMMYVFGFFGLMGVGLFFDRFLVWKVVFGFWIGMGIVVVYFWVRYRDVLLVDVGVGDGKEMNRS